MVNPMQKTLLESNFSNLKLLKRGKVRDIYDLGDSLLMVASDRISAFDVVMDDPIPEKGKILTLISMYWFQMMKDFVPNHVISADVESYPEICRPYAEDLRHRSMLVKKAEPLPIECVVRGYISGSGWKSYQETGSVCGIRLSEGLVESAKLPEPIFTPSTKAEIGSHDINIDFDEATRKVGRAIAEKARDLSIAIYNKGAEISIAKGIIIADTKFEFGILDGDLILIDEILTPDSSRFWPEDSYSPGGAQKSFDKQYLRDYLNSIDWDKTPPPPSLPDDVLQKTYLKYREALTRLTGSHDSL
jgi:phosphoribosylaminoimidazole-succinocarboxamide synthase